MTYCYYKIDANKNMSISRDEFGDALKKLNRGIPGSASEFFSLLKSLSSGSTEGGTAGNNTTVKK